MIINIYIRMCVSLCVRMMTYLNFFSFIFSVIPNGGRAKMKKKKKKKENHKVRLIIIITSYNPLSFPAKSANTI